MDSGHTETFGQSTSSSRPTNDSSSLLRSSRSFDVCGAIACPAAAVTVSVRKLAARACDRGHHGRGGGTVPHMRSALG